MNHLLTVDGLRAGYGPLEIVRGASLAIGKGEILMISGRNGCGKSTLLRTIYGLVPRRAGDFYWEGESANTFTPEAWASRGVVFAPQGQRVFRDLTLGEHFTLLGADNAMHERLRGAESVPARLLGDLTRQLRTKAGALSGGQRQRLCLAIVFSMNPRLVLLDEPTLGLDHESAEDFWEIIREQVQTSSLTVVAVEHRQEALHHVSPRVLWMEEGLLA